MKIGISTSVKTGSENWDRMKDLVNFGFKNIEFYNKITRIRTADIEPLLKLKKGRGLGYTFHSMVQDLFCFDTTIATSEYYCLRGEIKLASLIGCTRLSFHINKYNALIAREKSQLSALSRFASNYGIRLCLENNYRGLFGGDYLVKLVNSVRNLYLCLDAGHLNIALNKGLITDLNQFLELVKSRVVELHISYNSGCSDQHLSLNKYGEKYLEKIFSCLNAKRLLAVIETRNIQQALKIKLFLEKHV